MTPAAISLTGIAAILALVVIRMGRKAEVDAHPFGDVPSIHPEMRESAAGPDIYRSQGGVVGERTDRRNRTEQGVSHNHSGAGL